MLLSIGMIVKNEEKTLEKCLKAIQPILQGIQSELIIADTGSTDNTIAIAKQYATTFFEISWRNNFAWARNQGLNKASGKWFMFIDADEIFDDVSPIINFFKSGEFTKYSSASYIIKSHLGNNNYSQVTAARITKITKELVFTGKIHEKMEGVYTPVKKLSVVASHTGYEPNVADIKTKRNLPLLLEEFEDDPLNPLTNNFIVKEYFIINNLDSAKYHIEKGLQVSNKKEPLYHTFVQHMVKYHYLSKQYEKAIQYVDNYFKEHPVYWANAVEILKLKASCFIYLHDYVQAATVFEYCINICNNNKKKPLNDEILYYANTDGLGNEEIASLQKRLKLMLTMSGNFNNLLTKKSTPSEEEEAYLTFAKVCKEDNKVSDIYKIYNHAKQKYELNSPELNKYISLMESNITKDSKVAIAQNILQNKTPNNCYEKLQELRILYDQNYDITQKLLYFTNSSNSYNWWYSDIILFAMYTNNDFTNFINNMTVQNSKEIVSHISKNNITHPFINFIKNNNFLLGNDNIKVTRILSDISLNLLMSVDDDIQIAAELFKAYVLLRNQYLTTLYNPKIYNEHNLNILYEEDAFIKTAALAYDFTTKEFALQLKKASNIYPAMGGYVKIVIDHLADTLEAKVDEPQNSELQQHAMSIKNTILTLINTNPMQAEMVLQSYKEINPSDPDIEIIQQKLKDIVLS